MALNHLGLCQNKVNKVYEEQIKDMLCASYRIWIWCHNRRPSWRNGLFVMLGERKAISATHV